MKKQRVLNPYFLKILSYVLIALCMLAMTVVSTRVLFSKSNRISIEQHVDACIKVADGYAEAIFSALKAEVYALEAVDIPSDISEKTSEEICDFLKEANKKVFKDFKRIFYVDDDGMAWLPSGKSASVQNRRYFLEVVENGKDYYFSDLMRSKFDYAPVYVCAIPVYSDEQVFGDESSYSGKSDSSGKSASGKKSVSSEKQSFGTSRKKASGALCAAVTITTINDIIDSIEIGKKGNILIQNPNGDIIAHPKGDWIGKVFSQSTIPFELDISDDEFDEKIKEVAAVSQLTSKNEESLYVFKRSIQNTGWTVSYCVPAASFNVIMKAQNKVQILVIFLSIIITIILILIEMKITNVLHKKQLIDSYFDPLTHLMTRQRFEKEAEHQLSRNPASKFVLIEANIRGFKFYNQNNGEERANDMLIFLSKILNKHALQNKGILGRGYADHFYSLHKVETVRDTMKIFKSCVKEVTEAAKNYEIPFVTKFGITFHMPKSESRQPSIQDLIGEATFARKTIQDDALHYYAIFDSRLSSKSKEVHYIESHMEKALENREFFVMYQPKIDLATEKVIGAEALVRWQNPKLGFLSPEKFIHLFELNDFIIKLDYSVYRQVFAFIRYCLDNNLPVVPVSVNMSRNHSKPDRFVDEFMGMMREFRIPPEYVEVELLERSTLYKNTLRDVTVLLHKEGLKVAMDDFGSGESSLNMLSNIPVDILKFDRSFLLGANNENAEIDEEKGNFIKSLVDIGKTLKKRTVFEGVETEAQKNFLKSINCDAVQGFYYSKPLTENDYVEFLKKHI